RRADEVHPRKTGAEQKRAEAGARGELHLPRQLPTVEPRGCGGEEDRPRGRRYRRRPDPRRSAARHLELLSRPVARPVHEQGILLLLSGGAVPCRFGAGALRLCPHVPGDEFLLLARGRLELNGCCPELEKRQPRRTCRLRSW